MIQFFKNLCCKPLKKCTNSRTAQKQNRYLIKQFWKANCYKRWNLDGYICLQYSVVWGILGVLSVKFVTPVLMKLYHMVPSFMMQIALWALFGVLIIDILGSTYIIRGSVKRNDTIQKIDHELYSRKKRFGRWLEKHILMRVEKAYPAIHPKNEYTKKSQRHPKKSSSPIIFQL